VEGRRARRPQLWISWMTSIELVAHDGRGRTQQACEV
jgi:hypothetical protein